MDVFNSAPVVIGSNEPKKKKQRKPRADKGKLRKPRKPKPQSSEKPERKFNKKAEKKKDSKVILVPEDQQTKMAFMTADKGNLKQIDMDSWEFWQMVNDWSKKKEMERMSIESMDGNLKKFIIYIVNF